MPEQTSNSFSGLDTDLSNEAKALEILGSAMLSPALSLQEAIVRNYIKTLSITKTAASVRDAGIRKPTGRQYATKDISEIIKTFRDSPIGDYARLIFLENSKGTARYS